MGWISINPMMGVDQLRVSTESQSGSNCQCYQKWKAFECSQCWRNLSSCFVAYIFNYSMELHTFCSLCIVSFKLAINELTSQCYFTNTTYYNHRLQKLYNYSVSTPQIRSRLHVNKHVKQTQPSTIETVILKTSWFNDSSQ